MENAETNLNETKKEMSEQPQAKKKNVKIGIVVNTKKLRVRQAASLESEVLAILDKDTEVTILGVSKDFFKVTVNNINGYCLKTYIDVKGE